jgi:hypothetical protein
LREPPSASSRRRASSFAFGPTVCTGKTTVPVCWSVLAWSDSMTNSDQSAVGPSFTGLNPSLTPMVDGVAVFSGMFVAPALQL